MLAVNAASKGVCGLVFFCSVAVGMGAVDAGFLTLDALTAPFWVEAPPLVG